jgi:protein-S-isoprenylcysteine O-methyltransferase
LGEHFSHQLSYRPPSKLITHGIYDTLRHPSYTGFYYYSVGTQLLLLNPICAAGYAFVLSRFFRDRIEEEESRLQAVEGWSSYRKRTGVYIPGVD